MGMTLHRQFGSLFCVSYNEFFGEEVVAMNKTVHNEISSNEIWCWNNWSISVSSLYLSLATREKNKAKAITLWFFIKAFKKAEQVSLHPPNYHQVNTNIQEKNLQIHLSCLIFINTAWSINSSSSPSLQGLYQTNANQWLIQSPWWQSLIGVRVDVKPLAHRQWGLNYKTIMGRLRRQNCS